MTADGLACSFEHLSIGKDFVFEKHVSNSCTEKDVLVYVFRGGISFTRNRNDSNSVETVGIKQVDIFAFS